MMRNIHLLLVTIRELVLLTKAIVIVFFLSFIFGINTEAQVLLNTSASGGAAISSDKAANASNPSYTALGQIVIEETNPVDIARGQYNSTFLINAPTGWSFNTAVIPNITFSSGKDISSISIFSITSSTITVQYTTPNGKNGDDGTDIITIGSTTGMQIRADEGGDLRAANLTLANGTGTSINGLNGLSCGALNLVTGAISKLVVTLPGETFIDNNAKNTSGNSGIVISQAVGTSFNISKINATDQFFNVVTSFTGSKTIAYSGPGSSTGGSPTYTTAVAFASGVSTTTLTTTLRKSENVSISATNNGLYGNASSILVVNPKPLTITSPAVTSKTYDGTNSATMTGTLSGILSGDVVTLNGTGIFNSANVGIGKSVTSTCTLGGADAVNYTLTQPIGLTGNITVRALNIIGISISNKVYDGLTTASITGTAVYSGLQNGETFAVTGTPVASFATAGVGIGKSVAVSGYTAPSGNYTITQPSGFTANITVATLTYIATAVNRIYGDTNPVYSGTITGFVGADTQANATTGTLAFSSTATTTSGVGSYAITGSGLSATNYTLAQAAGNAVALTITNRPLTITASNRFKCFGEPDSFLGTEFTSNGLINGNMVSSVNLSSGGTEVGATAGYYNIVPSNAQGTGLENYTISYVNGTFTVNPKPIIGSFN